MESSFLEMVLLFFVGVAAGLMNVMAGGGSALTLPVLIFMGLDGALANGTNRIAILVQNIFAAASFKSQNVNHFRLSLKMAIWTLPGAILGAFLAVNINNEWFNRILGIVLMGVVLSMMATPKQSAKNEETEEDSQHWLIYPSLCAVGIYGGFIQVGVGFLLMAALHHFLKIGLVKTNMHKVFIVAIYTLPALAIFIFSNKVAWGLGLSLAAGNSLGGWWAARLTVRRGDKLIRYVLLISIIIMSAKLIFG